MMYWGDHMSTGAWIFSILATLIFLALIVALILWLVGATSSSSGGSRPGDSGESPKEILDRRLASGELSVEQYQQLSDTLGTQGEPPPAPATSRGPQAPPPRAAGAASG